MEGEAEGGSPGDTKSWRLLPVAPVLGLGLLLALLLCGGREVDPRLCEAVMSKSPPQVTHHCHQIL